MVPIVFYFCVTAIIVGLCLAWIALRGRKINDHPICRWCNFDLQGVYPESVTCPECGAGLKRDHAVRIGARVRRPMLAAFGLLLAAVPLMPAGAIGYAAITGQDINKYKPLGLLLWESKHAEKSQSLSIADELMARWLAGKFSSDQSVRVVEAALALQGDVNRPWTENWGDLIERAKLDGILTKAQSEQYLKQAAPLTLETREKTHAGASLPLLIKAGPPRVSSSEAATFDVTLSNARVGDKKSPQIVEEAAGSQPGLWTSNLVPGTGSENSIGTISVVGSRSRGAMFGGSAANEAGVNVRVPKELPPGVYDVDVDINLTDLTSGGGGRIMVFAGGRSRAMGGGASSSHSISLRTKIEILPENAPAAAAIAADTKLTDGIKDALRPDSVSVSRDVFGMTSGAGVSETARIDFAEKDLPAPIAYDVYIRDASGKEQRVGSLTSGKTGPPKDAGLNSFFSSSFTVTINGMTTTTSSHSGTGARAVSGSIELPRSDTVDVILRPNAAVAESTLDLSKFYGGEIVFKDVPVTATAPGFGEDPFKRMMPRLFQQLNPGTPGVPARRTRRTNQPG
ncbi:MAG: hypothetical protein JSR77_16380 [Planctomycetes bacterium]|nr:hypothetical protein [Planctomycetota bacterium]